MDPSGAFDEGKGTTGYCVMNHNKEIIEWGNLKAGQYMTAEEYWDAHLQLIESMMKKYKCILVLEDYLLYANKAESQINSRMETCRLIGLIQWYCFKHRYPIRLQRATEVKNRWEDHILERQIKLPAINRHELDSIRHAMHFFTFKNDLHPNKNIRKKAVSVFTNVKEDKNE